MRHSLSRALPYTPAQLFDLVADVERYPAFVPWIVRLTTSDRRVDEHGVAVLEARAEVGFSIVHESFTTRVRLDRSALAIDVDLLSGPFRRLKNAWRFMPAGEGARLAFEIDFELKSRLLDRLLVANFEAAAGRLVACFERRARALYG